jgi:hypothetical protein
VHNAVAAAGAIVRLVLQIRFALIGLVEGLGAAVCYGIFGIADRGLILSGPESGLYGG